MAVADSVFKSLQCFQSMMESFDESLSQLRKDNSIESVLDLWKNLTEYYGDLHKALQSRYEALKIKEEKPEEPGASGENEEKPEEPGASGENEEKPGEPGASGENEENKTSKVTCSSPASSSVGKVLSIVEVRPEIKILCDKTDGHGVINFIVNNMDEFQTFQNELPVALSKTPDAGKLVIKALEGYPLSGNDSDFKTLHRKRACIMLLESLFPVFGNDESGVVSSDVKDSAREIAKVWRKNMKLSKKEGWNIHAFLQLLASFRIAADYTKDELMALLSVILSRKETPELCRSLGLSSEAPNLISKLPKRGRELKTLGFAHVCGIMDKVDPVGLLTSYLRAADKYAEELLANGHGSADCQLQSNIKKLSALKNAIKHVQEYGLQSHFSGDNWEKKLRELQQKTDELKKAIQKNSEEKSIAEEVAREKEDGKEAVEKKAQKKEDGKKAAEKKAQEKEDGKKAAEKNVQHTRRQSFESGYGLPERENYASKRAKYASLIKTTSVAGGMGNSKASPYNIDGVQNKSGIIGHDNHTSAFSAANRSSTGFAASAFSSALSTAAQINDERRRNPSAFGTSNLTPIGSSLYVSSAPTGAFAVPMSNVGEINYEGRGQQSYPMNFGKDKNHVRASVYGTGDLAKSSATQSNYNYEGRGQQSYKLNFGEVGNNPVSASAYGFGILENSSATQSHYERRGQELFTSAFVGGNTSSIGSSSVYGSNSRTVPSSDVNQGGHERSLGQYSGFAGRNIVSIKSSGYGPDVSTAPPSNVTQGNFESRGSVIDRYKFNSGLTSRPPAY